jgi:hypothetical protein
MRTWFGSRSAEMQGTNPCVSSQIIRKCLRIFATRAQRLHWLGPSEAYMAWQTGNATYTSSQAAGHVCFTLQAILQEQLEANVQRPHLRYGVYASRNTYFRIGGEGEPDLPNMYTSSCTTATFASFDGTVLAF